MANKLIGIHGYARSGKDTIAEYLEANYSFIHLKFAGALRNCVKAAFNLTEEEVRDATKEQENLYWGRSYREMLQFVGTELFRDKMDEFLPKSGAYDSKNFWVDSLNKYILHLMKRTESPELHIAISDCRFENEIDYVLKDGGIIIEVVRPGMKGNVGIEGHISEQMNLNDIPLSPDKKWRIDNDGTLEDLHSKVDECMHHFGMQY